MQREVVTSIEPYNLSDFHKDLDEATKGPKRNVIKVLRKMLSKHGDFSDFGEKYPEGFKRLEDMCT